MAPSSNPGKPVLVTAELQYLPCWPSPSLTAARTTLPRVDKAKASLEKIRALETGLLRDLGAR